ncbi:MAG TPA: anti-sigma factor [Candidatus Acidoferrales bacterium]|nr:anti-sigma factor [Candidatus Acidoferrales bacterium]
MQCNQAQELITALVDEEISPADRASLRQHLEACTACQLSYQQEQELQRELRRVARRVRAPLSLHERVGRALQPGPASQPPQSFRHYVFSSLAVLFRPAFALALLTLLVLPAIYFAGLTARPMALVLVETYGRIQRGETLSAGPSDPGRLKAELVQAVGGAFAPMGYDFSAMKIKPTRATVRDIGGRKAIAVVYEGQGPTLICFTFLGTEKDAPPSAQVFFDDEKKMTFYSFRVGAVAAVLHREGDTICILASTMPAEDLLALARAKARAA